MIFQIFVVKPDNSPFIFNGRINNRSVNITVAYKQNIIRLKAVCLTFYDISYIARYEHNNLVKLVIMKFKSTVVRISNIKNPVFFFQITSFAVLTVGIIIIHNLFHKTIIWHYLPVVKHNLRF